MRITAPGTFDAWVEVDSSIMPHPVVPCPFWVDLPQAVCHCHVNCSPSELSPKNLLGAIADMTATAIGTCEMLPFEPNLREHATWNMAFEPIAEFMNQLITDVRETALLSWGRLHTTNSR